MLVAVESLCTLFEGIQQKIACQTHILEQLAWVIYSNPKNVITAAERVLLSRRARGGAVRLRERCQVRLITAAALHFPSQPLEDQPGQ